MIGWIEKIINPPGIQKPARRSLFEIIGAVGGRLKADALRAFNAHFPYLADREKLAEHGAALLVPRMTYDTDAEYRDRVTAASFFLTRAGERGYIIGQLDAHFGGRYIVIDEFLNVYVKVRDLGDADRRWLFQLLDELINPNVRLSVAEWFHFIDTVISREVLNIRAGMSPRDTFNDRGVKLNGRVKLDGRTINGTVKRYPRLDGRTSLDGAITLSGAPLEVPATGRVRVPVRLGRGILETLSVVTRPTRRDVYAARTKLNGALKLNAYENLSGHGRVNDVPALRPRMGIADVFDTVAEAVAIRAKTSPLDRYRMPSKLNGISRLEGGMDLSGERRAVERLAMSLSTGRREGYAARLRLNGAVKLDGTEELAGYAAVNDKLKIGLRYCWKLSGQYALDGQIKLNSGILLAA